MLKKICKNFYQKILKGTAKEKVFKLVASILHNSGQNIEQYISYLVQTKRLDPKWLLNFSYKISETADGRLHQNQEESGSAPEDQESFRSAYFTKEGVKYNWLKKYSFNTIIDVGANQGQFTGSILTVFPDSQIHSFEPLPEVYQKLCNNFSGRANVHTYNVGLGERNEEMDIHQNEFSLSSSLLPMTDLHKSNFDFAVNTVPQKVTIRIMDEIFLNNIRQPLLLKIDVQGYEMHVLKGGGKILEQADVVILETSFSHLYAEQPLFDDIYKYLQDKGFRYAGNIEQLLSPVNNEILQADSVFISYGI